MRMHLPLLTDSYKVTHWRQYPPGTEKVESYLEARVGSKYEDISFFGATYICQEYLAGSVIDATAIDYCDHFYRDHLNDPSLYNRPGWVDCYERHEGRLPVSIRAVPEGMVVPHNNVLMTIENTDPEFYWLPNYLETLMVQLWYPNTVASQSREMRKIILAALKQTGNPDLIDFKLHDFGFRGVSSVETAMLGAMAHLSVGWKGTDTVAGVYGARHYYGEQMAGFSIPAAEHSTITSWLKDGESAAYKNMLEQFPNTPVAVVSDSYDIWNAVKNIWGGELKDDVLNRDGNNFLVIRPDSGVPYEVVPKLLNILGEKFGYEKNEKGYKVLPPCVRVIQGDGIDIHMLAKILVEMKNKDGLLIMLPLDQEAVFYRKWIVILVSTHSNVHQER